MAYRALTLRSLPRNGLPCSELHLGRGQHLRAGSIDHGRQMHLGRLPAAVAQHAAQAPRASDVAGELDAIGVEARLQGHALPLRFSPDGGDAQHLSNLDAQLITFFYNYVRPGARPAEVRRLYQRHWATVAQE